jgi:arylformamidase
MKHLFDISPTIDPDLAVWPGDTPFSFQDRLRLEDGAPVHLSTLTLSCHTGAHADAPGHYAPGAPGIDCVPLEPYLGPCQVLDVRPANHAIHPDDLADAGIDAPRVLFRTRDRADRTVFPEPFTSLTPELVDWLAARNVILIGLDTPSVDRVDSKELPCHKALFRHGIANLESLQLDGVPEGRYELIALPLRLAGRDASPVRAVLRELDTG